MNNQTTQEATLPQQQPVEQAGDNWRQLETTDKTLDDFTIQGQQSAALTLGEIRHDIDHATNLIQAGVQDHEGIVEELHQLEGKVQEDQAAFERKSERLKSPYVISPELAKVLKVARLLKKPMLVEGEPGTGKTALAYALAGDEDQRIIHCRGKSTLTAQSVMYDVDYVGRLNDAMLAQNIPDALKSQTQQWVDYLNKGGDPNSSEFRSFMSGFEQAAKLINLGQVSDIEKYIKYGELGEAISAAAKGEKVILLFDEIDKAKREFPNDLLDEIEHMSLRIRETGREISAPRDNITIIITSNHERDLPEPFLRRCVYSFLEFPTPEHMTKIVQAHIPNVSDKLLEQAVNRFYKIRSSEGLQKKPSTSEMLDWVRAMVADGQTELQQELPFLETLLKTKEDMELFGKTNKEPVDVESLKKAEVPEEIVAVLKGEKVLSFNRETNSYYDYDPPQELYLLLANNGIPFKTADYRKNREFEIMYPGIRKVGKGIFAFSEDILKEQADLVKEFIEKGYVKREYAELKVGTDAAREPIQFAEIEESNELYIKGKDTKGRIIYKFHSGKTVVTHEADDIRLENNTDVLPTSTLAKLRDSSEDEEIYEDEENN